MSHKLPARLTAVVALAVVVAIACMPWWADRATIYLTVEILATLALAPSALSSRHIVLPRFHCRS